jgi:hypothetical protein
MTDRRKLVEPIDGERLDLALKAAVQRAIWEHKQLGIPICVVRDGKRVILQPEEIVVEKPTEVK